MAMGDGASEFSDWEVLSAASSVGADGDGVLVSDEGGDVLHDHFDLVPDFSAEGSWSGSVSGDEVGEMEAVEFLERFDSISQKGVDLIAVVDSSARLRFGEVGDETAEEGVVLEAALACGGATWSAAEERHCETLRGAMDQEEETVHRRGDSDSIPQAVVQGAKGVSDFDETAAVGGFQIETPRNSSMELEDGGEDAKSESSPLEFTVTSDVMQGIQEEVPEQGKCASNASSCAESDGEGNDGSSPVADSTVTGKGERQLVVWWRLPFRLLHYCAWKVKPVWSISIAAALLGLVVLGRRMYRMKRKTKGIPQIKIAFDDKRASQFADRAARLNEAFLIARRLPAALKTSSGAVLPWSMVQER